MSCSGNCEGCSMKDTCASGGVPSQMKEALEDIKISLETVQKKILVLSGKGGVGKSTVVYLLSQMFSKENRVGVLDLDLCGPSIPILFDAPLEPLMDTSFGFEPCRVSKNISVVSIQFFLQNEDDPIIARGPKKNGFVLQLIREVDWGETDVLIVDTPPGTSDEHLAIVSFLSDSGIDGAVIVTTPDEVSLSDVRREIRFCQKANINIIGVVENMSSFHCPFCDKESTIFERTTGGAKKLCEDENLNFLGQIPIHPTIVAGKIGQGIPLDEQISISSENIMKNILTILDKN